MIFGIRTRPRVLIADMLRHGETVIDDSTPSDIDAEIIGYELEALRCREVRLEMTGEPAGSGPL